MCVYAFIYGMWYVLYTHMYMEDAFMARVMNGLNLNKFSMILPSITENETK